LISSVPCSFYSSIGSATSVSKIGILRDKKNENEGGEGEEGGYSNFFEELR
jgi:hypothetical protein